MRQPMKVNHNGACGGCCCCCCSTSSSEVVVVMFDEESKRTTTNRNDESNGNRMKAPAHKRQVGPIETSTLAATSTSSPTTTTTTTTASTETRSRLVGRAGPGPVRGGLIRRRPQLLLLTLILLAGGLGTLATQSNHHARELPSRTQASSSLPLPLPLPPRESRELKHESHPIAEKITATKTTTTTTTTDAKLVVAGPGSQQQQQQPPPTTGNENENENDKLIGQSVDVRESLMDLDREVREGYAAAAAAAIERNGKQEQEVKSSNRQKQAMTSPVRRLLVRQLTNLIMNHEPETIAARMRDSQMSDLLQADPSDSPSTVQAASGVASGEGKNLQSFWTGAAEPAYLISGQQQQEQDMSTSVLNPDELADNYLATTSSSSSSSLGQDPDLATSSPYANGGNGGGNSNNAGDTSLVTCPPDYDDPAFEASSSNLDIEQQQQLFNGANSSGLLSNVANRSGSGSGSATMEAHRGPSSSSSSQSSQMPQCVHPGMRMIEVITKIITPILFTIIIIVGLLGNIIVMMVILEDRQTERELTPTNLLILDLSLADLSFIIFCIPFTGWDYSVGHWVFGSLWCKFNQYLIVVCALSSIYTLVLMSIDRFMAIVYPIECISYRTSKNTLYAIYIKWIVILLMASPTIAMHGLIDLPMDPHQYACRFLSDQYDPLSFQITFFITSYLFPLVLIFCLYLSLLNKLWFGTKPHGHKESLKMLESKKKVTWLVAGIVVVFAICWCPIQVMLILMRLKSHKITATYVAIQVFSHTLGYMNSCVNPIVYAFASETFTNSFKRSVFGRFFRVCFCSSGAQDDHGRSGYNYHSARPSNATFHNTTTLNYNNNNNNNDDKTVSHHHHLHTNHQPNSHPLHHKMEGPTGRDDSFTCSTKTSQLLNNCDSNSSTKQVVLPLEPRDRGVSPTFCASTSDNARQFVARDDEQTTTTTTTGADRGQRKQNRPDKVLIPREATISREDIDSRSKLGPPTKQQLVARVIQTGHNQSSQKCETACYQQEVMGP